MENLPQFSQHGFMETVGERKLARLYPWILAGLVILYFVIFPIFKDPILIMIPAVVAGWFYYRRGGILAGVIAIAVNLFLINIGLRKINADVQFVFTSDILFDYIFVILAAVGVGSLRSVIESYYQTTKQLHKRERHLILTNIATKDILAGDNLKQIYYRLLTHLTNLFTADSASLARFDETLQKFFIIDTTRALEQTFYNLPLGNKEAEVAMSTLESGHVLFIDDLQKFPTLNRLSAHKTLNALTRSAVLLPLTTKDYKFGVIILAFDAPYRFNDEEVIYIESTGRQITLALRNIHQERMIKKQLREAETLANIEHALSKGERIGVDAVLQLIVDAAKEMIPNTQRVVLHLLDENRQILIPRAVAGYSEGTTAKLNMPLGEGIAGQVIVTGEVATIADIRTDSRFISQTLPVAFRSLIVAPIQSNELRIGTISVHSDEIGVFSSDETNLLSALGAQAALAIENANLLEKTRQNFKEIDTLYHLTQNLATSLDLDQLMKDAVEFLQKVFGYYHIQIYIIDNEKGLLVARHGSANRDQPRPGWTAPG